MDAREIGTDTEYKKGQITSAQIDQRIAYDDRIQTLRNSNSKVTAVTDYNGTHKKNCVDVGSDVRFDQQYNVQHCQYQSDQIYAGDNVQIIQPS